MGPCASRPRASPAAGSSSPMDAPAPSGRPSAPDSVLERSGDAADASSAVTTPRAPASSVLGGASAFAPSPSRVSVLDGASTPRFSGTVPPPPTERDELDVFDDDPRLLPHANLPDADLSSLLRRVSASVGPDVASALLAYAATDAASDDAAADDDTPVASLNQLIAARDWGATLARLIILGPPEDDHPRDHVDSSTDPTPSHVDTTTVRTTKSPSSPLLPLHHAVAMGCPPEVVDAIARGYPGSARADPRSGNTPLHVAARVGSDLTVVERLLAADPSAASLANANGATPLHAAAGADAPDERIVALVLAADPSAAATRNRAGDYPLHYACRREITPETTAAVLRAFPAAANRANDDGAYPVHYAARYRADASIVASLASLAPESVSSRDVDGFTPLHLAQGLDDCAETMRVLLRAAPDAWATADHRGCLPVHLAAGNGGSEEAVSALLRAAETTREEDETTGVDETTRVDDASGSARPGERSLRPPSRAPLPSGAWTDAEGNRPLHHALGCGASVAVVRLLLRAPGGTAAAAAANDAGNLPAHVAAAGGASVEACAAALDAYPAARRKKNVAGQTPRDVAAAAGAAEDVRALFAMTSDEETA